MAPLQLVEVQQQLALGLRGQIHECAAQHPLASRVVSQVLDAQVDAEAQIPFQLKFHAVQALIDRRWTFSGRPDQGPPPRR
jgi:hypothetical protein